MVIFELPRSVMKSSDCSFFSPCLIKLSPVFFKRRRWKKLAGVSTQRIPKTNTTPSCYYRWPDRRVRREASSRENLSNYRFSDAVTGRRIDCKAELLIPSFLPSFLACFLPHLPVKQPTCCHHFAMLVRLQLSARCTACREAAAAIRHRALERLWLCAHKTQPPAASVTRTWIRAQRGRGRRRDAKGNINPASPETDAAPCAASDGNKSSRFNNTEEAAEVIQLCILRRNATFPTWLIWDSLRRVGSDVGSGGVLGHYCDYKWSQTEQQRSLLPTWV